MKWVGSEGSLLWLAFTLVVALANVGVAGVRRVPTDPVLRLLEQGKVEEAAHLVGSGSALRNRLEHYIKGAETKGDSSGAIRFYEVYLRYFPFGFLHWEDGTQERWSSVATAYIERLASGENPRGEWFEHSLDSLGAYKRIRLAYKDKDAAKYTRLTDEILAKHPRSIFAQAAVMTTCRGRAVYGHGEGVGFEDGAELLRGYLKTMDQAGIPEKERLLVMLLYQSRLRHQQVSRGHEPTQVVSSADIVRLSENPFLRRAYLGDEIAHLLKAKDRQAARARYRQYLDEFPESSRADGRLRLVSACLGADDPEEAVWWIRQWEKVEQSDRLAEAVLAVADYYAKKRQWGQAARYYDETVRNHPKSRLHTRAKLGLAQAYRATGADEKMITLLKEVADLPAVNTHTNVMDTSNTRNIANERLAEYYMEREKWREALKWWQRWKPSSWCGTCADELEKRRTESIEICHKQLQAEER